MNLQLHYEKTHKYKKSFSVLLIISYYQTCRKKNTMQTNIILVKSKLLLNPSRSTVNEKKSYFIHTESS